MIRSVTALLLQVGLILVATVALQGVRPAQAQDSVRTWSMDVEGREWEVHPATPTYEGTTGLFHLPTAYSLPKGKVSFSVFGDNLDRSPKDLDITMVGVALGYGITQQLELFGNFDAWTAIDADALYMAGRSNEFPFVKKPWEKGIGDAHAGLKFKILDDYAMDAVGLAIRGTVKIPSADKNKGLGTGKPSYRGDLILSKNLNNVADIHMVVGYQVNTDPKAPVAVDLANEIKYGVGVNVPVFSWIQLQAEVMATSYKGGNRARIAGATNNPNLGNAVQVGFDPQVDAFGVGNQKDPVDLVVGPVLFVKPGFFIRPAFSANLNPDKRGTGTKQNYIGAQLSIGFHPGFAGREIDVARAATPVTRSNQPPTVSCTSDRPEIMPGETVGVHCAASDPEGDPLTYAWSTTAGSVTGTGANATLDYTGVTAPTPATVTVRVADNHGNTTPCSMTLAAGTPRRAEAVSCVAGGFPRNLSRLTNVDKACLDDVAQRLKADPRATVIVIGHADSREAAPQDIGQKRADAVRDYLVQERGIEAARITTRSAADTKPLDTGTDVTAQARNRRVEAWFVPEGATVPE